MCVLCEFVVCFCVGGVHAVCNSGGVCTPCLCVLCVCVCGWVGGGVNAVFVCVCMVCECVV